MEYNQSSLSYIQKNEKINNILFIDSDAITAFDLKVFSVTDNLLTHCLVHKPVKIQRVLGSCTEASR